MADSDKPFRVIVVGAGVTGLVASNCLHRAGIDHVVLEKRDEVAPPEGASIAMYPHGARILHQLGALKAVQAACVPTDRWWYRGPDGKATMNNGFFNHLEDNFGCSYILLERRRFLQILYDTLPDQTRIKTGFGVNEIKHVPGGVEVTLSNGEVEKGDMVIGCDGAYSSVKSIMWEHANKLTPGRITVKEKTTYRTDWKAVVGVAPQIDGLGLRDMTSVSAKGHTFISFSQPDRIYFFFIFAVKKPYTWPRRPNPLDEDAEALAESVADHPISETTVFGELWKKRYRGQLIYLEDGVLNHWHSGRIVLTGDAVHKFTPNMGFGGNCGIESVAVLCNSLNRLLKDHKCRKPSAAALDQIFHAYQEQRIPRMKEINELCRLVTKVQAWHSPLHKFMDRWYFPLQWDTSIATLVSEIIRNGEKLDYLDDTGFPRGTLTWKDDEKVKASSRTFLSSQLVRLAGAAAALLIVLQGLRFIQLASATPAV